jgi:hypothetical protein
MELMHLPLTVRVVTGLCPVRSGRGSAEGRARSCLVIAMAAIATIILIPAVTSPTVKAQAPHKTVAVKPDEDPQLYRNATFGFRYQIPYGWVNRTKEMKEGTETAKSAVLLAVFERPPEATGDTVNSAVVVASESAASYPGLKKTEDYLGPLTELATSKGFKTEGEPGAVEIDSRQLLRADFIKPLNDKLTMYQCTLFFFSLAKAQIVSFTFIAGSDDELDELVEGLHFGDARSASKASH